MTSGCVEDDNTGLEVDLNDECCGVVIKETYNEWMLNIEDFYDGFPHDHNESNAERTRRLIAVTDAVRNMHAEGQTILVTTIRTPFRADKSTFRYQMCGSVDGGRVVHVDFSEKKKVKQQRVFMMSKKKTKKSMPKAPQAYSSIN